MPESTTQPTVEPSSNDSSPNSAAESSISAKYMAKPEDSYTKLAMRNMVRRGGTSLFHFGLTLAAVLGGLIVVSYLFH
ncbi:MAG: DUF3285 domain-containing protein [Cyanobacteria bacterium P01_E01_bin.34]